MEGFCLNTGGQQIIRGTNTAQMIQFPSVQQTIPVQVPVSTANGQTIYQTVHFPVQALTNAMPAGNILSQQGQTLQMIQQLTQVKILTTRMNDRWCF